MWSIQTEDIFFFWFVENAHRRHLPIKVRAFIEFLSGLGLCSEILENPENSH